MTELANVFLKHGYDVTMVLVEEPLKLSDSGTTVIERTAASNPSISFHVLPSIHAPDFAASGKHPFLLMLELLHYYNEQFEAFLCAVDRKSLHSVVLDMFCIDATDVCMNLGVPPMPASHLIKELLEHPEDEMFKAMMNIWKRNTETMGVLLNTFESLESRAVQSLRGPLCVPERILPPIYCVGPLVGKGAKDEEKLKEIAIGFERSGQRFLWSVRMPAGSDNPEKYLEGFPEPELDALLPQGFLERTNGRGLVIKSWAPQMDVLGHRATGAFVTHCGWNSVLEAIVAGVPMLCLLLEGEQRMNKVSMTEGMGVAVELEGYMTGFVKAGEVEAKVRLVIEGEEGRHLRARVAALREEAKAALEEGGPSRVAFAQFLLDVDNLGKQLGN
ncbi:hypothetical protein CFC21_044961 [Triticum aestivum]|uniref:Glycosyltransferase n=2 Tax=Triticum aestivum TaxID=4565 RepID=A0A3B6G2Y5_WHEAT|nr:hypothetical protein CFC21_044961 [Triticum aestivum]